MGKADVDKGIKILNQNKIPNYYFPERAAESLKVMIQYAQFLKEEKRQYQKFDVDKARVKQIFEDAIRLGRRNLPEADAREVLAAYVIRIPKSRLVRGTGEAKRAAQEIGFPVVLKIASPNILHKSDVGGIKVGIESEKELERAYREILWNANRFMPEATIWGVLVQEMVPYDREVIVGVSRDPQFGPLVMFGLGGIYVEVLKDVSFRVAPLTERDAQDMIQEIRSFPLLSGVRGQPKADLASLKEILLRVSQLVTEFPQINEMDINPIKVGGAGEGAVAVDARITLEE
jgi:acetyltransferase